MRYHLALRYAVFLPFGERYSVKEDHGIAVLFIALSCLMLACVAGVWMTPRVSPSRAPVLSRAHYFQAPATQASLMHVSIFKTLD